jgi:hypothetical protein
MPSDPVAAGRKGGKIGGARNTPLQQAARKRNVFQKVKPVPVVPPEPVVEKLRRVVNAVLAPSNLRPPKPQPATVPDEMAQEETSDDFTL